MDILRIRHNWPEAAGFELNRPHGAPEYVLLHFHNGVSLEFGGRRVKTQPGALILFSPSYPHHFWSAEPLLHDWMHLTGAAEEELAIFGLQPNTLYQPGCGPKITQLTAQLEAEFFAQRRHWRALSQALLTQLWVLLARDLTGEASIAVPRETADRLRALRADMLLHPEQAWSNEKMAQYLGLSVSRLYPLYRRMFSISPGRDLILMRVEKAKNMLLQGETVARTAECMGYANLYHFIRQFKQITGVTPGQAGKNASGKQNDCTK